MRRRVFTVFSVLSLLLCVATAVLWVLQEVMKRPVVMRVGGGSESVARFVAFDAGAVVLEAQWVVYVEEGDPSLGPRGLDGGAYFGRGSKPDVSEYHRLRNDAGQVVLQGHSPPRRLFPSYVRREPGAPDPGALVDGDYAFKIGPDGSRQSRVRYGWWFRYRQLVVPAWILLALSAPLPAVWITRALRQRRQRRRAASNRCPVCGYDLRATRGRCPECGTVLTGLEPPHSPPMQRTGE
jgi:hypothetical protein